MNVGLLRRHFSKEQGTIKSLEVRLGKEMPVEWDPSTGLLCRDGETFFLRWEFTDFKARLRIRMAYQCPVSLEYRGQLNRDGGSLSFKFVEACKAAHTEDLHTVTTGTEDQILFWSIGSAAYAVLIPASITLLIYLLSDGASDDEINGGFWGTYACCVIVSVLIVPVDGPSHFVFPFLYALGALKLVIASPLTLPVAVCAFVICLGFLYLRRTECMLGVSALALVLAGCGGIVQLSYQFKYVHQLRAAIGMTEALDFPDFLSTAAGHLDDIQRCGAGSIETAGRSMSATCDVRAALNSVPSVWTLAGTRAGLLAFVLAGLVWPITGKAQEVCSNISVWWYREKA